MLSLLRGGPHWRRSVLWLLLLWWIATIGFLILVPKPDSAGSQPSNENINRSWYAEKVAEGIAALVVVVLIGRWLRSRRARPPPILTGMET
jgi:hypothetical protein